VRRTELGHLLDVRCSVKPRNLELFIGMWQFEMDALYCVIEQLIELEAETEFCDNGQFH